MRYMLMLGGLAALLLMGLQAFAAPSTVIKGEYAVMAKELNMPDDQQVRFSEKIQIMNTALSEWDKQNKEQIAKLKADQKAARDAKDANQEQAVAAQLKQLTDTRNDMSAKLYKDVMDVLTPAQKQQWVGISFYNSSEYPAMVTALKVTPAQEAQLKAKVADHGIALSKWDQENTANVQKLEQQIKDAQAALDALKTQRSTLLAQRTKLDSDQKAAVAAAITPEQQKAWQVIKLQQSVEGHFRKVSLTPEQMAKIKPLCEAAATEIIAIAPADTKARTAVQNKLMQSIADTILTKEQKAAM